MKIRKGTEADMPGIIGLLKTSLGESLIPKSTELWRWKHINNPFGPSPVLVAEEGGQLVGVRAFLRWKWMYRGEAIPAIRAVDTATHPDFQGKGIFKKLTLQGLEDAKTAGIKFVYNTPNESSKPGYLKMGWISAGRIPLKIKVNPFSFKQFSLPQAPAQEWERLEGFLPKAVNPLPKNSPLYTAQSPEYLVWRYKDNPLFQYEYLSDYTSYVLFYRIKKHGFGLELRIVDFLTNPQVFDSSARANLNAALRKINKNCLLVSASGGHFTYSKELYPSLGIVPIVNKGPILTLRNLSMNENDFLSLDNISKLGFSLGDMELF